jgi:hypothetical protein
MRLVGFAALALVFTPAALAHVTVSPATLAPGVQKLTLKVPNELQLPGGGSVINEVEVESSPRIAITRLEPNGNWTGRKVGGGGVWTGGSIPFGKSESFVLSVEVPRDRDQLSFVVATHFRVPPQRRERFPLEVPVAAAESNGGTSTGVVVAVALAAAAVLLALAFILARWLRGPGRGMRP